MPPKRKTVEHEKVTVGRAKIRRGAGGKRLVEDAIRNNVLLFLEKLKDDEAQNPAGAGFQSVLSTAVSGALDPLLGPEAVIDLASYGFEGLTIFGNKQAGQLLAPLLTMLDDGGGQKLVEMQGSVDSATRRKEEAEKALAYLQELIPLSQAGRQDLAGELEALENPVQDAAWLYEIMWIACLQWMDTRLRQLRSFARITQNNPQEPTSLGERAAMINTRIHGGNLRIDALVCNINFGYYRHHDANYDIYIREAFRRMYRMSLDDGLWLAKHGHYIVRGVDWPQIIGFIDKFVAMYDRVHTSSGRRPENWNTIVPNRLVPFTAFVSSLIAQAKANPAWTIDAAGLQTIKTLQTDLYNDCQSWVGPGEKMNRWDAMGSARTPWAHADYLRDVSTSAHQRIVGQGAARMTLRPLPRIKYN